MRMFVGNHDRTSRGIHASPKMTYGVTNIPSLRTLTGNTHWHEAPISIGPVVPCGTAGKLTTSVPRKKTLESPHKCMFCKRNPYPGNVFGPRPRFYPDDGTYIGFGQILSG